VKGNGGGISVANRTVIPAWFSILCFRCSIFCLLTNRSSPFSPPFRASQSTKSTPITDPTEAARTYAIHPNPLRSELVNPISNRSLPKGRTRKEESSTLNRKIPKTPNLLKNLKRESDEPAIVRMFRIFTLTRLHRSPNLYTSNLVGSGGCGSVIGSGGSGSRTGVPGCGLESGGNGI